MHSVAWQPGGSGVLLTASADRTGALWDARAGQCCLRLRAGGAALASAAFSPQARMRQRVAAAKSRRFRLSQQLRCMTAMTGALLADMQ